MTDTPRRMTAAPLTPMSPKELEDLRTMMWLADVGHAPTMAVTMQRLLLNIDELTTFSERVRGEAIEECARWHDGRAATCVENATKFHPAGAVYCKIMETAGMHLEHAKAIRALSPTTEPTRTDETHENG